MIFIKVHKGSGSSVTSICDSELVGKAFKEGKLKLDVSERFYKGEEVSEKDVDLNNAKNLNIVGKRSINIALKFKCIPKENILFIQGVPHAQSIIL